jgi:hypothetical protein
VKQSAGNAGGAEQTAQSAAAIAGFALPQRQ